MPSPEGREAPVSEREKRTPLRLFCQGTRLFHGLSGRLSGFSAPARSLRRGQVLKEQRCRPEEPHGSKSSRPEQVGNGLAGWSCSLPP